MTSDVDSGLRDQYCFGCGRHNPIGMHLAFERTGAGVAATYTTRREDQGFPGTLHGGLLALLLDEAMGWAMYADRIFAVTARMETRFRRPAALDETLTVHGRITRDRGRRIEVAGEILDSSGAHLVEASGLFLRMRPEAEASALATFRSEFGSDAAWGPQ
ncbi:MAG: hotdog fold domain-containing protein [Chloroflexi bacterium]|nr:hotdog fold domain-containing protein [Chloroflexota bacterium]